MIESFMHASAGTSHIFNTVQENQSPQAMVRSSVASRPGNSINWYIFSHLFRITRTFSSLVMLICIHKFYETEVDVVTLLYQ
jgi:hypothetical protein